MFPNYKDFQVAVYYTLGKALPKHIGEVQTEIIENCLLYTSDAADE